MPGIWCRGDSDGTPSDMMSLQLEYHMIRQDVSDKTLSECSISVCVPN